MKTAHSGHLATRNRQWLQNPVDCKATLPARTRSLPSRPLRVDPGRWVGKFGGLTRPGRLPDPLAGYSRFTITGMTFLIRYSMHCRPLIALLIILGLLAGPALSLAEKSAENQPTLTELVLTASDTHILLFATVKQVFTDEMIDGLRSGVPIKFSFFVELTRKRPGGKDPLLTDLRFQHTMTFDTLKELYRVELEETNRKILTFASMQEAEDTLNDINGLKVIELAKLDPKTTYNLRVRADVYQKSLPQSLKLVAPFLSLWDKETEWQSIEFKI